MNLTAVLEKLPEISVLCIGDLMLDRFVNGSINRISPEAPIPVLGIEHETRMLGGAGNVVANLASLGVKPRICSIVGNDHEGDEVRKMLGQISVDTDNVLTVSDRPTSVKTRFIAQGQQMLRTDYEKKHALDDVTTKRLLDCIRTALPKVQAIILSDYGKGILHPDMLSRIISMARDASKPIIVDPKGSDYTIYRGASVVTPNRDELEKASNNMPTKTDEEVEKAARHVLKTTGIEAMIATRSADGLSIIDRSLDTIHHLKTQALDIYDVSGAGDTVVATIAGALGAGAALDDAARLANIAGGIVVGKVGTATIRRAELEERINDKLVALKKGYDDGERVRQAPSVSWDDAREQLQRWQKSGLKVGFTNGCFDLLHPGHLSLLQQARQRCDRLIVGVNCDASVKRLKGDQRPVHDEISRTAVLGALSVVDLVVLFGDKPEEEDSVSKIIEFLSPDLLVKGADYTIETVVGARHVLSYGGDVYLADLVDGKSTSSTIEKINQK